MATSWMQRARTALGAVGSRARAAWDTFAYGPSAPASSTPWNDESIAPLPPSTITSFTLGQARRTLQAHELGQFSESALIADHMLRDADVQQALHQRVLGVLGLPFELREADESKAAEMLARTTRPLWPRIAQRSVIADLLRWAVLLGFAIAQVRWMWDDERGEYLPVLEPWHPAYAYHDPNEGKWYATTRTGTVEIIPGDGRWVLYAPTSPSRPYMYGAVRCLPEWFLSAQFSRRDANKFSEMHGQGVWVPRMPEGWQDTTDGKAFVAAVRNMGRSAVIPAPRGSTPESSYDIELREAQSRAWEVFDFLVKTSASKIRLSILGQDMTSMAGPRGGSHAQSKVGDGVRQDYKEFDSETLGDCLQTQLLSPWAQYQRGKRSAAPRPFWNATPPPDLEAIATALDTAGTALATWKAQMSENDEVPDEEAFARQMGLPLKPRPVDPPAPDDSTKDQPDAA